MKYMHVNLFLILKLVQSGYKMKLYSSHQPFEKWLNTWNKTGFLIKETEEKKYFKTYYNSYEPFEECMISNNSSEKLLKCGDLRDSKSLASGSDAESML